MRVEDLACLEAYLRAFPELERMVSIESLRFLHRGNWRKIVGIQPLKGGVRVELRSGEKVRLEQPGTTQHDRRSWKVSILDLLKAVFPMWKVEGVLAGTDRVRHHSAALLRVLLSKGRRRVACVAAYPECEGSGGADRALTTLLLWWDQLQGPGLPEGSLLLIPEFWNERLVQHLPYLNLPIRCFKYRPSTERSGVRPSIRQIYPRTAIKTEVRSPYVLYPSCDRVPARLQRLHLEHPDLQVHQRYGSWELSYLGLPVAWQSGEELYYDCLSPKPLLDAADMDLMRYLQLVRRLRRYPPPVPRHPYYVLKAEQWLESLLMKQHRALNSDFVAEVYSQVPTFVDGERKVLDLLTATRPGQLAVIELKIEKDLELVFQALDYWERVRTHARRGDFERHGYFPGTDLLPLDPLIYLVCPLFEFHRVLPVLRAHLSESVGFECIGIPSNWRKEVRVIRRFRF